MCTVAVLHQSERDKLVLQQFVWHAKFLRLRLSDKRSGHFESFVQVELVAFDVVNSLRIFFCCWRTISLVCLWRLSKSTCAVLQSAWTPASVLLLPTTSIASRMCSAFSPVSLRDNLSLCCWGCTWMTLAQAICNTACTVFGVLVCDCQPLYFVPLYWIKSL